MATALKRHDELMREAIETHHGYVFKTVGDGFCSAFASAASALEAASHAQRALAAESWPAQILLRVRLGLHTGACEERDGDYYGPVVNRVARLMAIAWGGQTLLSRATAELVQDELADGYRLRDLGRHRLKDLGRPEYVYQLDVEGLQSEFPSLRSLSNPELRHNLPGAISSFVGRQTQVSEVCRLLSETRILTLSGPGGVGKTRLALQVAAEMLDGSGDGVWLVELAPLEDAGLVALATANTLGVREEAGRSVTDTVANALRDRSVLVILDNCEHVIEAAASLAETLVRRCGGVAVMATSREPLSIPGEHVYRVPSLSQPEPDEADPVILGGSEAVRLFAERAAEHRGDFRLDAVDAGAVGRLCRRLDGIPLAIELATARLRSMSVGDLERHLDQRFRLLVGGSRTAIPRQRTLEALIDWSYALLAEPERLLLAVVSVFAGGFDEEAAQSIAACVGLEALDVIDLLGALVDKSLIQADDAEGSIRYRMLESIREFAATRLAERGENIPHVVRSSHRDHYLAVARAAELDMHTNEQTRTLDRLEREYDNLRIALSHSLADPDPTPGLDLAASLISFWDYRGYAAEGTDYLCQLLDRAVPESSNLVKGRALCGAALLLAVVGNYSRALDYGGEAELIARAGDDAFLLTQALRAQAAVLYRQGRFEQSLELAAEGLEIARRLGELNTVGYLLSTKGFALNELGQDGYPSYTEALELFRDIGNQHRVASILNNIACLEIEAGHREDAQRHLDEAMAVARELGDRELMTYILGNLGLVAHLESHDEGARSLFIESVEMARRNGYQSPLAYAVLGLAFVLVAQGDHERGAILHGTAETMFDRLGERTQGLESRLRDQDYQLLSSVVGPQAFEELLARGRRLKLDEVVAMAPDPDA
jgi:predicted ATPase